MPVLVNEVSRDLGLSLVQIGTVWAAGSLAGVLVSLPGGLLGDRFGVVRTIGIASLLSGLALILKGLSVSFFMLAATSFLCSLVSFVVPVNVHKTISLWFQGRHLGLANGAVSMGMGIGAALGALVSATVLSPLLGGWRNVLFLYGIISIIISLLWLLLRLDLGQNTPAAQGQSGVPFIQALSKVVRIKNVWLLGIVSIGRGIAITGLLGYLALYLERYRDWSLAGADGALTVVNAVSTVAVLPVALLSDKLGSRVAIILPGMLVTVITIALIPWVGPMTIWMLLVLLGIFSDSYSAIFITMIQETKGVGTQYAGTAMGLVFAVSGLFSSLTSPLSYSLADMNPNLPFVFWAGLAALSFLALPFMQDIWRRKKFGASVADVSTPPRT